jgi:hypothetical protein
MELSWQEKVPLTKKEVLLVVMVLMLTIPHNYKNKHQIMNIRIDLVYRMISMVNKMVKIGGNLQ